MLFHSIPLPTPHRARLYDIESRQHCANPKFANHLDQVDITAPSAQQCQNRNAQRSSTFRKWRRRVRSYHRSSSMAYGKLRTGISTSSSFRSRTCEIPISRMSGRSFRTAGMSYSLYTPLFKITSRRRLMLKQLQNILRQDKSHGKVARRHS